MYENLRRIRKERGMTCEQMGELLNIATTTYSKKERGKIPVTLKEAKIAADFFGDSIDSIFFENTLSQR